MSEGWEERVNRLVRALENERLIKEDFKRLATQGAETAWKLFKLLDEREQEMTKLREAVQFYAAGGIDAGRRMDELGIDWRGEGEGEGRVGA